ncbi:MAG: hypothetical protein NT116_02945 [Candidatus Parcubacteria bacterium]|nr:hypothetical protein [Candidatus Parcubacteria bacterium]
MKLNKVTIICLAIAGLLTSGVLLAKASGFVSYEDDKKIILWDNVRVVANGINFSDLSALISPGNINIGPGKDLYIRKFIGFNCPSNYPENVFCAVRVGDVGGHTFLQITNISGQNLTIQSESMGIDFEAATIEMTGQLVLNDLINRTNLVLTNKPLPKESGTSVPYNKSVYVDTLRVNTIKNVDADGLTMPKVKLRQGAFFITNQIINYKPPQVTTGF